MLDIPSRVPEHFGLAGQCARRPGAQGPGFQDKNFSMPFKALVSSLLMASVLAGCSSTPPLQENVSPNLTVVSTLPDQGPIDEKTGLPPTQLGPYDVITYDVLGIEGMSGELTVDGQGMVSFPIAGRLPAAGLTVGELQDDLVAGLKRNFVRNPQVAVNLKEMVSQRVTVEGSVIRPGSYPVLPHMGLLTAIASAQGLAEFAKTSEVVVFRTVGGSRYATLYDLQAIREGRYDEPRIYPQDVVVVGDSPSARMFKNFVAAVPGILAPLTVLLTL